MKTRSGYKHSGVEKEKWTGLHLLYYAGLYEKIFDVVGRQLVAHYNIENDTEEEKFRKMADLEKLNKTFKKV